MAFKRTGINSYVKVKLTEHGKRVLKEQHAAFCKQHPQVKLKYTEPVEDAEGYSRWHLWALMKNLGPHIGLAKEPMFECDVFVDVYD